MWYEENKRIYTKEQFDKVLKDNKAYSITYDKDTNQIRFNIMETQTRTITAECRVECCLPLDKLTDQQIVKAYITNNDLKSDKNKKDFISSM